MWLHRRSPQASLLSRLAPSPLASPKASWDSVVQRAKDSSAQDQRRALSYEHPFACATTTAKDQIRAVEDRRDRRVLRDRVGEHGTPAGATNSGEPTRYPLGLRGTMGLDFHALLRWMLARLREAAAALQQWAGAFVA